jgi:hypothetical protein
MDKDKEIALLKKIIKAQATMIIAYRVGKPSLPNWVFDTLEKAKQIYGPNLQKIE